ncbi:MAG: hypothetical protein NUV80_04195 [Candidatus Berkelbacteria bacterium]|nr:hypothetical protein [Candidatus Berkelbacteria bacterium]MCR4307740.1 hypothetical protein [Candidatus Berkelbacteria bacterium]
MSWWSWLFGGGKKTTPRIDWLEIESRQRQIDAISAQNSQLAFKQAIIESDKLIDSIMKSLVTGATFADRLKALRPKFPHGAYDQLWKAHIKRNELVHDNGSFVADWELSTYMRTYREVVSVLRGISLQ